MNRATAARLKPAGAQASGVCVHARVWQGPSVSADVNAIQFGMLTTMLRYGGPAPGG